MFNDKKKIIICISAILVVTVLFIIFVINRNQNKNIIDLNSLVGEENQTEESSENLNNENLKGEENSEKGTNAENSGMNTEKQNSETIVIHITGEVKRRSNIFGRRSKNNRCHKRSRRRNKTSRLITSEFGVWTARRTKNIYTK